MNVYLICSLQTLTPFCSVSNKLTAVRHNGPPETFVTRVGDI